MRELDPAISFSSLISLVLIFQALLGEVAEWSKAADCKSVSNTHVGSNPTFLIYLVLTLKLNPHKRLNRSNFSLIYRLLKSYKSLKYINSVTSKTTPLVRLHKINNLKPRTLNAYESYFTLYNSFCTPSSLQRSKHLKSFTVNNFSTLNYSNLMSLPKLLKSHKFLITRLMVRVFSFLTFVDNQINPSSLLNDIIVLNYRRRNFFPCISSFKMRTFVFSSLGLFSRKFLKSRSFIRSKALYLLSSSFLRKVLIYASFTNLLVYVKRKPLYLQEILSTLFSPVIAPYKHPFLNTTILENTIKTDFNITNFIFFNNKSYTYQKKRLRGRLKRRIAKRLIKSNNVLD